jgi:DNA-binding NarL/FixJ family response regulator
MSELVASGESKKIIARQLGPSFRIVELPHTHIIEKLQVEACRTGDHHEDGSRRRVAS